MLNTKTIQYPYSDSDLLTKIVYSGGNPIYIGRAAPGMATSAAAWQICKLTWSGSDCTAVEFAGGTNDYDQVWDDRAGLAYS